MGWGRPFPLPVGLNQRLLLALQRVSKGCLPRPLLCQTPGVGQQWKSLCDLTALLSWVGEVVSGPWWLTSDRRLVCSRRAGRGMS